jgi:hypothetical protein
MQTGAVQRCSLITLAALAWASSAHADVAPDLTDEPARVSNAAPGTPFVAAPEPMSQSHWYGWQTLLVDGAALTTVVGGLWLRPAHQDWSVVSIVGVGGLAVGAPIVHWAHGHTGVGFASLGLRLGLPALGALIALTPSCSGGECSEQALALALGVTLIPAPIVLDATWLARERETAGAAPPARAGVDWAPFISAFGERRMLGVSGRF